jgi:hypothetical protein
MSVLWDIIKEEASMQENCVTVRKKKFGPTGLFVWAFDLLNVIAIYLKVEISMAPENLLSFF